MKEQELEETQNNLRIDRFFSALSEGEQPEAKDLDLECLEQVLSDAGANLNPENREGAIIKLANKKYTEVHPNRRPGVVAVWGEEITTSFEVWAQNASAETCPRFKDDDENPIDGSQSRGLRQLLADLTEMAIGGGMDAGEFAKRTKIRVERGMARSKKLAVSKSDFAMIPVGSLDVFWNSIRSGGLPH